MLDSGVIGGSRVEVEEFGSYEGGTWETEYIVASWPRVKWSCGVLGSQMRYEKKEEGNGINGSSYFTARTYTSLAQLSMRPTHTYLCTSHPCILTYSAQLPLRSGPLSHFNNTPPLHPPLIPRHVNPQPTSTSKPTAILSQASPIPAVGRLSGRLKAQKQSSASQILKSSTLLRHRQVVPTLPGLSS